MTAKALWGWVHGPHVYTSEGANVPVGIEVSMDPDRWAAIVKRYAHKQRVRKLRKRSNRNV